MENLIRKENFVFAEMKWFRIKSRCFNVIIPAMVCFLIISGCTEKINVELNDEKNSRLVVDGGISSEKIIHRIKLTRTTSYFANQPAPRETGATVSVTDGTITIPFTEIQPGLYVTDSTAYGEKGKNYILNIRLQNGTEYSASSKIKSVADIDSVSYRYEKTPFEEKGDYIFSLYAKEPKGKGDNYMFNIYLDGILDNDTIRETSFEQDDLFDGEYLPGIDFYYLDEDDLKKDTTHIRVEMLSISKGYFDYLMALMLETDWKGGMFSGPPANIPTNINNGALGFFWAAGSTSYEFDLIKE